MTPAAGTRWPYHSSRATVPMSQKSRRVPARCDLHHDSEKFDRPQRNEPAALLTCYQRDTLIWNCRCLEDQFHKQHTPSCQRFQRTVSSASLIKISYRRAILEGLQLVGIRRGENSYCWAKKTSSDDGRGSEFHIENLGVRVLDSLFGGYIYIEDEMSDRENLILQVPGAIL